MTTIINVNGRISDAASATVSVLDHGFLYGEGVYETLRTYHRQPFLFERHVRRLRDSAALIGLGAPFTDEGLRRAITDTIAAAARAEPSDEWYIRILLTRGVGPITYDPLACPAPSLVIIVKPFEPPTVESLTQGVRVSLSSVVRNHPASVSPRIKSNNLLNNALAMQEALRLGAYEALMRNYRGELTECSQSNFFLVRGGAALTPPLDAGLLEGITRNFIFDVGIEVGVTVAEAVLRDSDLETAEEAFLTSTTREIIPIVQVGEMRIGSGAPGPVTARLLAGLREMAAQLTLTATNR